MKPAFRIASFAGVLALVFAAAALAGSGVDLDVEPDTDHDEGGGDMKTEHTRNGANPAHPADNPDASLPGLAVAQAGYRLVPDQTTTAPGTATPYRFRIVDRAGETVRRFDTEHERRMHLIVVRRDFAAFQHLHPRQRSDGSWGADIDLALPGVYRVFADFATNGRSLTLAADLFVAGRFEPRPLPPASSRADAGDGYEVELDSRSPRSGSSSPLAFTVTRHGRQLDSVEPYLGADGHLVALREHDQAFLHTHPKGEAGGSGPISFQVEYPTAGSYRLFLQFKHRGEVRTAAFTQEAGGGDATVEHVENEVEHGH